MTTRWQRLLDLPESNIAVFAFLLNLPWEFWQVPFFDGISAGPHWEATLICTRAAIGDAGITLLAFWAVAGAVRTRRWVLNPGRSEVAGFVLFGILATIGLEWVATGTLRRWSYAESMPTVPILGTGVLPLLQWIFLPPLVLWFVRRQLR